MPARKKKQKRINLLPQEVFAETTLGRVLKWLLSTFRFIVISVELIVVVAFLSRFWLDTRITDLNDEIKQKSTVISSYKSFEKEFRKTQLQLNAYSQLEKRTGSITDNMDIIYSYLPPDTKLVSVTINPIDSEIRARGLALNDVSVAQYIAGLNTSKKFVNVTLIQANTPESGIGIDFTLKIDLNKT